jgi:hypothetical protein
MTVQVSRLLRIALEYRWGAVFNGNLQTAIDDFSITALGYQINFAENPELPQNFYRGDWSLENLLKFREPDPPILTMWIGVGAQYGAGQREMPRTFSGFVFAHWRFFLAVKGLSSAGLTDLREATESAMVATLADEFSEVTYRGDLAWQAPNPQIWLDQDNQHVGFVQEIEFQASFEVSV